MSRNRPVSPSMTGVTPRMNKMYDGRNVATRPIPVIVDTSDLRAIAAAASDQKPKASVVNMPSKPRPTGADTIFGTKVARSANLTPIAGIYEPAAGIDHTV